MKQDDEDTQDLKRCKLENSSQNESQNPSNDTINSNSNSKSRKKLYQDNAPQSWPRCLHCQTESTPQWRIGPMGPKTLCNACGVQFHKFGRLLPEYRPVGSPTYVPSKHSHFHKKVIGMRRQEPDLRVHQRQAQGLGFQVRSQPVHGATLLHKKTNTFFLDTSSRGSESVRDASCLNPNSFNIDISKFLKRNATRTDVVEDENNSPILMKMLTEGLHTDITLQAQGGCVKAHRCVLASASPIFDAMFKHQEMKDHKISDMNIEGLQLFLVLLYTAKSDSITPPEFEAAVDKHLVGLFQACHKYNVVSRLKSILISALSRNLTPENCWEFCNTSSTSLQEYLVTHGAVSESAPSSFPFPPAYVCFKYTLDNFDKVMESKSVILEMKRNPELVLSFMKAYTSIINGRQR